MSIKVFVVLTNPIKTLFFFFLQLKIPNSKKKKKKTIQPKSVIDIHQ